MHEEQRDDFIETRLVDALAPRATEPALPELVHDAVGARRAQRRRRQLGGISAFLVLVASVAGVWMTQMSVPSSPPIAQVLSQGPVIVRTGGCGDATVLGLMRCNGRFEGLLEGEIVLNDDWDLGWVGSSPALEPGET